MVRDLTRREILEGLCERRLYIALPLTLVLVALSLFCMQGDYARRLKAYEHSLGASSGKAAILPPTGLSLLARGLDEALGREFRFDDLDRGMILVGARAERTSLLFALFATPDLLFVYMVVMSLIAFLFTYDAISGERAAGTLQLVLAQPVSRAAVLLGKVLGRGILFGMVALSGLLGASAWFLASGAVRLDASHAAAFGLFTLLTFCYLAVFLALGLLVSTASRRPSTSLAVLLLLWCGAVFVVPNLLPGAARASSPLPSAESMREARSQRWVRAMYLRSSEEAARVEPGSPERAPSAEGTRERADVVLSDFRLRLGALVAATQALERLTPAGCYLEGATAIAGTGLAADARIKDQVERLAGSLMAGGARDIPAGLERPPLGDALRRSVIPCAGLLLCQALALFIGSMWVFSRCDAVTR